MRILKISLPILFLFLIANSFSCQAAKKIVAVMPLYVNSSTVQSNSESVTYKLVAENMANQLVIALHNSNIYTVVEREQLNNALKEIGFQIGGAVDPNQAIQSGKMLGVQYSVIGKVNLAEVIDNKDKNFLNALKKLNKKNSDEYNQDDENQNLNNVLELATGNEENNYTGNVAIDIKFLNNETGEIILATEINGNANGSTGANALRSACKLAAEDFLSQIVKQAPFSAAILDVDGDTVYIDKGSEFSLHKDEILIVSKEGVPITNLEGKIIAVKTMILGKLKIVEVNDGYSICKIIEQSNTEEIKRGCIAKRESK